MYHDHTIHEPIYMTLRVKVLETVWSGVTDNSERKHQMVESLALLFPGRKSLTKIMHMTNYETHTVRHTHCPKNSSVRCLRSWHTQALFPRGNAEYILHRYARLRTDTSLLHYLQFRGTLCHPLWFNYSFFLKNVNILPEYVNILVEIHLFLCNN